MECIQHMCTHTPHTIYVQNIWPALDMCAANEQLSGREGRRSSSCLEKEHACCDWKVWKKSCTSKELVKQLVVPLQGASEQRAKCAADHNTPQRQGCSDTCTLEQSLIPKVKGQLVSMVGRQMTEKYSVWVPLMKRELWNVWRYLWPGTYERCLQTLWQNAWIRSDCHGVQ